MSIIETINATYTEEYKRTRCVQCGKLLADHRRYTAEDIAASKVATCERPVTIGSYQFRTPLSPCLEGQWIGHDPMPWKLSGTVSE